MGKAGIWNSDQEKYIAGAIDNSIKAKGVLEIVDGYLAKVVIVIVDDKGLDRLPEDLKPKLSALTDLAIAGDVQACEKLGAEILNNRIDIPGIDEQTEYIIFNGAMTIIVGAILAQVRKLTKK